MKRLLTIAVMLFSSNMKAENLSCNFDDLNDCVCVNSSGHIVFQTDSLFGDRIRTVFYYNMPRLCQYNGDTNKADYMKIVATNLVNNLRNITDEYIADRDIETQIQILSELKASMQKLRPYLKDFLDPQLTDIDARLRKLSVQENNAPAITPSLN